MSKADIDRIASAADDEVFTVDNSHEWTRAVLRALREPTYGMVQAYQRRSRSTIPGPHGHSYDEAANAIRAFVDHLLDESQ